MPADSGLRASVAKATTALSGTILSKFKHVSPHVPFLTDTLVLLSLTLVHSSFLPSMHYYIGSFFLLYLVLGHGHAFCN